MSDYARAQGIDRETLRRATLALEPQITELVHQRRPGPRTQAVPGPQTVETHPAYLALVAINAILRALLRSPLVKLLNSPEKRGMVVKEVLRWEEKGVKLQTLAVWLGLSIRTLQRWIRIADPCSETMDVHLKSRKPKNSPNRTPQEIREAIFKLARLMKDCSVAEIGNVFRRAFRKLLANYDLTTISNKTIGRYLKHYLEDGEQEKRASQRGDYEYPPPLAMAWIDTAYFTVAGVTVHIVGAMEAFSRMVLAAEVFVQENAEAAIEVLSSILGRVPELSAVLRDRGKPYLNEKVNDFLAKKSCLPIDAHPYYPLDKAALERWWGTLKPWLRQAVETFQENCRREGIIPPKDHVVDVVRSALRVAVRAYNLLGQDSFEGTCPYERLEATLKDLRSDEAGDSILRRLIAERRNRDSLLTDIRDGLQLEIDIATLRKKLGGISDLALKQAMTVCYRRLIEERDPKIYRPFGYFIAVARNKEQFIQEQERRTRHLEEEQRRKREEDNRRNQEDQQRQEDRCRHPENYLLSDLKRWLECRSNGFLLSWPVQKLWETLRRLRYNRCSHYEERLASAHDQIPQLVNEVNPSHNLDLATLSQEFLELAIVETCP